jgi:hypothetical protein
MARTGRLTSRTVIVLAALLALAYVLGKLYLKFQAPKLMISKKAEPG